MICLNINVAETIFVQDVFGTFTRAVLHISKFAFSLLDQSFSKMETFIDRTVGRAPPVMFSYEKKGTRALGYR